MSTRAPITRDPQVFQEERQFLLEACGFTDPRIAQLWRMSWATYCRFISRNALPAARNPDYQAEVAFQQRWATLTSRRRGGHRPKESTT